MRNRDKCGAENCNNEKDSGHPDSPQSYEETVNISVGDVNETPYDLKVTVGSVVEGVSAGGVIGKVAVTDDDFDDTIEFGLIDDADGDENRQR